MLKKGITQKVYVTVWPEKYNIMICRAVHSHYILGYATLILSIHPSASDNINLVFPEARCLC